MSGEPDSRAHDQLPPNSSLDFEIDSIPDAIVVADPNTSTIVEANTAAGDLFGCEATELIGCSRSELHPADGDYAEPFQRALNSQRVNRLQNGEPLYIKTFDGERLPVEINAQRLETANGVRILGVFREVTDQLEREQRLKATTSRLRTLLEALPIPTAVLDSEGVIEHWNQASEVTFGYAADSVIGERYPLFIEDDEFEQLFKTVAEGGTIEGYETHLRAQDGSRVPVEVYARPVYEEETLTGIVGAAIDLSDRQQREQQLSVLYRVLRHNLRNELTAIRGWTRELASNTPEQSAAIERIETACEQLLTLTQDAKRIRTGLTDSIEDPDSIPVAEVVSLLSEKVAKRETVAMQPLEKPDTGAIPRRGARAVSLLLDEVLDWVDETTLELSVETRKQYIVLELTAVVSLLPSGVRSFINTGEETALEHGQDLTGPRAHLMITSIGGDVAIKTDAANASTSTLRVEVPRVDGKDPL
jgi:PAS domain S-box-containing protein